MDTDVKLSDAKPYHSLLAAYWVDDPESAYADWVEQLRRFECADSTVRTTSGAGTSGEWAAVATRCTPNSGLGGRYVGVQLWNTEPSPLILLESGSHGDTPPPQLLDAARDVRVIDPPDWNSPPPKVDSPSHRQGGTVLFEEQGSTIHVPEGAVSLTPTLPTSGGTGGSFTVLAATDAEAAIRAMQDEATATIPKDHRGAALVVTPPETTGNGSIAANWVLEAGGWGFSALATKVPDERDWLIYVSSDAD